MKKFRILLVVTVAGYAAFAQEPCRDRMARVRAVADSVCSITNIASFADDASIIQVDFVLKPEPGSDIRCKAVLPSPERWNGRLWGSGNSGFAGKVPEIRKRYTGDGSAAMTTDCGTWSITDCGETNTNIWPMAVIRDYSWRATHLMTVYGKRIVEAYYGKPPRRSYFCGGSCGGRQAYCEAVRYPEDYDGIIATLPANNPIINEIANWLLWRNTHDSQGRLLFTVEEMRAVSDAAVEYMAATDPKPYAGRFLADGRVDEATLDGMLALAAKKMPSLAEGDKLARLKAIHSPTFVDGECRCLGFAPGTYLGKNMMQKRGAFIVSWMRQTYGIAASEWQRVTWKEMLEYVRQMGPMFNSNASDLSRFFACGGKLISNTGWEDQSISPYPIIDHYERICAREGGLEKAMEHCRLFCIPGGAHGGGKGRAMAGGPDDGAIRQALVKWVEEGIAPERLPNVLKQMRASKKVVYPEVAAYPGLLVQDDAGKWVRVERPRSRPQLAERLFSCDVSAEPQPVADKILEDDRTWMERLKSVEDGVCSITNMVVADRNTGLIRVDFVLKAEEESDIRCRAELPPPAQWDGRMWGVGNSSWGGFIPKMRSYSATGSAVVTTDIGTWAVVAGKRDFDTWPVAVRRDYSWRSTHMMTFYGKRLVEAYYGRAPRKSYFYGGSCGGRQAFSEAIRYPEDYDGIVTHLPANNFVANRFNGWLAWYYTRDKNENLVFTTNEMQVVADAAVEYRAASDPKPYAGRFLADGRATPEEVDAMLALAAKKMPSLLEGDKLARLKALYTPFCVNGKCMTPAFAPGTYLGQRMKRKAAKRWQSVLKFAESDGDWYNANDADLTPFFSRGGRMMIVAGWEDQTISPLPVVEHYERICAFEGGLEKTMEHCRLFCAPGVAHGGGYGRATQGGVGKAGAVYGRNALIRWVEEGVAPDRIMVEDKSLNTMFPVATYPGLFVQDSNGEWRRTERPRSKPSLAEITFKCDRTPEGPVPPEKP